MWNYIFNKKYEITYLIRNTKLYTTNKKYEIINYKYVK